MFCVAEAFGLCYVLATYAHVSQFSRETAMINSTMINSTMIKSSMVASLFCCSLLIGGAFAQMVRDRDRDRDKDDSQATKLVVLEHLWNEAQVNRDERALEGMIADSFVNTEWDGDLSERGKFLADIKDPKFKPDLVTIQNLKVNLYHNAGVVTGVYHTKGSYNGKPYDHLGRFTDTWIFQDGKWECVASHTSLVKK